MNSILRLTSFLIFLSLVGCTITKRHYNSGYDIRWHKNYKKNDTERLDKTIPSIQFSLWKSNDSLKIDTDQPLVEVLAVNATHLDQESNIPAHNQNVEFSSKLSSIVKSTFLEKNQKRETKTSKRALYIENKSWEKIGKFGKAVMIVAFFILICVVFAFFLTNGNSGTGSTSIFGLIITILFGLLGLLFISLFGLGGAFLFSLSLAAFGALILLISHLVLKARNRYNDQ